MLQVYGQGAANASAGQQAMLFMRLRDAAGNEVTDPGVYLGLPISVQLQLASAQPAAGEVLHTQLLLGLSIAAGALFNSDNC